ncbi:MAG: AtzG-like protein [Burkholderiales bacterium]
MTDAQILAYVQAVAAAQGLSLSETRAASVAGHLALAQRLAAVLDEAPLSPHDELVQTYCPAPFPSVDAGGSAP